MKSLEAQASRCAPQRYWAKAVGLSLRGYQKALERRDPVIMCKVKAVLTIVYRTIGSSVFERAKVKRGLP